MRLSRERFWRERMSGVRGKWEVGEWTYTPLTFDQALTSSFSYRSSMHAIPSLSSSSLVRLDPVRCAYVSPLPQPFLPFSIKCLFVPDNQKRWKKSACPEHQNLAQPPSICAEHRQRSCLFAMSRDSPKKHRRSTMSFARALLVQISISTLWALWLLYCFNDITVYCIEILRSPPDVQD
jgi:hypothetical protein